MLVVFVYCKAGNGRKQKLNQNSKNIHQQHKHDSLRHIHEWSENKQTTTKHDQIQRNIYQYKHDTNRERKR